MKFREFGWSSVIILPWLLTAAAMAEPPIPGWKWQPPDDRPFPIVAWYGPGRDLLTDEVWQDVAEAGFNLCLPSFHGTDDEYRRTLDLGEKFGIGFMLGGLVDWELGKKEEDVEELVASLQAVVDKWSEESALAMYVLKDEPHATFFKPLGLTRDLLARMDPGHISYVNLFPNYAPVNDEENWLGALNYRAYVDQYMKEFRPEVLIYDHYCIEGYNFRKADYAIRVRPGYFENLEIIRAAALEYQVPFWAFTLSTPVFSYPTPTEGHLRFQLNSCLAYGAKGLQYFTYGPVGDEAGIVDGRANRGPWYEVAKRINWEIQNMGELLLSLISTEVFHTSPQPRGTTWFYYDPLYHDEGYGGLSSCLGAPALLGFFDGPDDRKFLMVVNRDPMKAARLTLTFSEEVAAVGEVDRFQQGGIVQPLDLTEGKLTLMLEDGGGRLLELKQDD